MDFSSISAEGLFFACLKEGHEGAWTEFIRRFNPLIGRVVLRIARQRGESSPEVIDDLIQETYLKLCTDRDRILREFQPAHKDAIYGYIKVFTANLVYDHFKLQRSQKRGHSLTSSFDAQPEQCMTSAGSSGTGAVERNLLMNEVDECLKKTVVGLNADRDRRIFWLYYRVGLTANAIAALPDMELGIKGIETTLYRLSRQIRLELTKPKRAPTEKEAEGIRPSQSLYEAGSGE